VRLPAYPRYKPSGVEWLGDVPEHWDVKRLKTSARCWVSNVDKVPAEDELPVRLCNYTDVYYHEEITADMELMETTATAEEIDRFGLREGDVLITKDSEDWRDIAVPALVRTSAPDLVCGYHLGIIRSRPKVLFGDYLLRAFQSCAINQQFQVAASGVTRYGLPKASIGDAWIPIPATNEQQAIAAFLDGETGRVRRLVAKKQELIERLKEKRTALISRTVTHGLPPLAARAAGVLENPRLKPSGLDWLGDIPAHWEVRKFSRCAFFQEGPGLRNWQFTQDGIRVICVTNITEAGISFANYEKFISEEEYEGTYRHFTVARGDLLLSSSGNSWGKVATFDAVDVAILNTSTIRVNENVSRTVSRSLIGWLLISEGTREQLRLFMTGACQPNFGPSHLAKVWICVPPAPEQAAIAVYLNAETAKLDALVGKVEEAVERLQEYRTALITAAVTGKIDVRNSTLV
jgi:type I restriction enzyme S subunit